MRALHTAAVKDGLKGSEKWNTMWSTIHMCLDSDNLSAEGKHHHAFVFASLMCLSTDCLQHLEEVAALADDTVSGTKVSHIRCVLSCTLSYHTLSSLYDRLCVLGQPWTSTEKTQIHLLQCACLQHHQRCE